MGDPRNPQPEPSDPLGPLVAAAVTMHSLFVAYRDAGFTEDQALRLVAYVVASAQAPANPPDQIPP